MILKECFITSNGISCITTSNSLHNLEYSLIKKNIIFYISLRLTESIIIDFFKNIYDLNQLNNNNNSLLNDIIFS